MSMLSKKTLLKGLEEQLASYSNSEEKDAVFHNLADYVINDDIISKKKDTDKVYNDLEKIFECENIEKVDYGLVCVGKDIFRALKTQRDYNLGFSPDKRKLKKVRNKEIELINGVLNKYESK